MERVAVVTDSAAALPSPLQAKYGITVVPLGLKIDGEFFSEGVNVSPPRVVAALMNKAKVAIIEPSAEAFARTYRGLAAEGVTHVVSVHVSGAMQEVVARATEGASQSPVPVTVIDTRTLSMATGFCALAAASRAANNGDPAGVADAARSTAASSRVILTVETLEYAHRDGQVPGAVRALADTLHVRPILEVKDGLLKRAGGARNTGPAREEVRRLMEQYAATLSHPAVSVALVGGNATESGLAVTTSGISMETSPGATLTAHSGPGTYVVCAVDMPPDFAKSL